MATSTPTTNAVGTKKRKARDSAPFDTPLQPRHDDDDAEPAAASLDRALRDVKHELAAAGGAAAAAPAATRSATMAEVTPTHQKITFRVEPAGGPDRSAASQTELELSFIATKHTLFDLVDSVCENWIHDDVHAHMWIVEHLTPAGHGTRYIGPFGEELVDDPSDVGVAADEGPLLSAMQLQAGAKLLLRYDMGSTTSVILACRSVGPAAGAGESLPSADWRGGLTARVPPPADDWARSLYPAVYCFLMEDDGVLDVGLGNSFDKRCELSACNCGGTIWKGVVGEGVGGLGQALGRLDLALRSSSLLDDTFYADLPAAEQKDWPKQYPRIVKFISKRPAGFVTVGRRPSSVGFVEAVRGNPRFPSSKPKVVLSEPQAGLDSLSHVLELLEAGLAKEHSGLHGF